MKNWLGVVAILISTSTFAGERWVKVGEADEGIVYIDITTFEYDASANEADFWAKALVKKSKIKQLGYSEFIQKNYVKCTPRMIAHVDWIKYLVSGVTRSGEDDGVYRSAIPDSMEERILDVACEVVNLKRETK